MSKKYIEEAWKSFEQYSLPPETSKIQRSEMAIAFKAGAASITQTLIEEPTDEDMMSIVKEVEKIELDMKIRMKILKLSPRSASAFILACEQMLEVALRGEDKHPHDSGIDQKAAHSTAFDRHLEKAESRIKRAYNAGEGDHSFLDPDTNLPHLAYAMWRLALMNYLETEEFVKKAECSGATDR